MLRLVGIGIALAALGSPLLALPLELEPAAAHTAYRTLLDQYCITCHSAELRTAGLVLADRSVEQVGPEAPLWEKVLRKLRSRAMPPAGMPRPEESDYQAFTDYLENQLDAYATANPDPGRPVVRRLNRTEYTNAIRDLFALEINSTTLLPPDTSGYGFDNIGDVLTVTPMLLSRYMSAARHVSQRAIGNRSVKPDVADYEISKFLAQGERTSEGLPLGARGVAIRHFFPVDGEYAIRARLKTNFNESAILGLGEKHQVHFLLDRQRVAEYEVGGEGQGTNNAIVDGRVNPNEISPDEHLITRVAVKAGSHDVGVAFVQGPWAIEQMLRPTFTHRELEEPSVGRLFIEGPFNVEGPGNTASRQKIFVCRPADGATVQQEESCAGKILTRLARLAYRRPISDEDVPGLMAPFRTGRNQGGFEAGIKLALQRILISPEFLLRIERDSEDATPGIPHPVSDLELASRLSFFLWSSIPDDELLEKAERGELKKPEVLEQQVRRLLKDPRSHALVDNFAGQWLFLRNVGTASPDPGEFPEFDENLREALQQEAELFVGSVLSEDRSVVDLLEADYTFLNERLARHYGVPNVYGSHFRRVTLRDDERRGLLGKGGVQMVTSYPNRTSPVLRGKWVLENLLGTPPPPPPPDIPALGEAEQEGRILSMRERMEQHRGNPVCASCHARMDPLGFALENFDAIGRWRDTELGIPIDSSGILPDGTPFQGPSGLRQVLLGRRQEFVLNLTEKLLTYALGRGVEYYDAPAVREILGHAAASNYQWSSLVLGIVKSTPFQMRRSKES